MVDTTCNPCCNPRLAAMEPDSFRQAELQVLCEIKNLISTQVDAGIALSLSGNTSGTMGLISSGTAILAGGNNITLSQNGQSVTISGPTLISHDLSLAGNTSGTLALLSSGTVILAGGNNITLSQNGQSVTISGGAGGAFSAGMSTQGSTVGTTGLVQSQLVFVAGTGLELSQSVNGQSATLSFLPATVANRVSIGGCAGSAVANMSSWASSIHFQPFDVVWPVQVTQLNFPISVTSNATSPSSNTSYSGSFSYGVAIYTYNPVASGISLQSSISSTLSYSYCSSTGNWDSITGARLITHGFNATFTPGQYYLALSQSQDARRSDNTGGTTQTTIQVGVFGTLDANNFSMGYMNAATVASLKGIPFFGFYSSSNAFPNSVGDSDLSVGPSGFNRHYQMTFVGTPL